MLQHLVNDVVPVVLGSEQEQSVEDVSGLLDESLKPAPVVLLATESRHLHPLHDQVSPQYGVSLTRIPVQRGRGVSHTSKACTLAGVVT